MKGKKNGDTYRAVVDALKEINRNRTFGNIGTPEREDLDRAVLLLEELSWKVVSDDIAAHSKRMGAECRELRALNGRIRRRYSKLNKVVSLLKKATSAVSRTAGAAEKAV